MNLSFGFGPVEAEFWRAPEVRMYLVRQEVRRFSGWAMRHVPAPQGHDPTVSGFLDQLETRPSAQDANTALSLMQRLAGAA